MVVVIGRRLKQSCKHSTSSLGGQLMFTQGKPSAIQNGGNGMALVTSVQVETEDGH